MTKVVLFAAIGLGSLGRFWVDGDGGMLLTSAGALVVMPICIAGSVDQMRGRVSPLPGRDWRLVSPIAGIAWASGLLVLSIVFPVDIWLSTGEPTPGFRAGAAVAAALCLAGVFIQIASLSDQWPDRWRPPYARQPAPTGPDDGRPGPDHAVDPTGGQS